VALRVRDTVGALPRRVLRRWDRIPIRVQGRITVGLPLLAVVISAVLAIIGNTERVAIETDIQRRFQMNAALGDLTSLMTNAETGMRGYLLTGQTEFLEPFDQASRELPAAMTTLGGLASSEDDEATRADTEARLQDLRGVTAAQMADLSFQRGYVTAGRSATVDGELRRHLVGGKALMDRIRSEVRTLQDREQRLLDARLADIDAIRTRDYVSVAVALIAAVATRFLAWFLFRKGTLRRVDRLTEALRDRRHGRPPSLPPPTKRDQMGELEHEVHLLDR
jgi:CHASE3 domain sensor protein